MMVHRIVALWRTLRRHGGRQAGPVAALAALLLVGCLVLLAAPGSAAPPATRMLTNSATPTGNALHQVGRQLVQQAAGSTPGSTPTPTDTPGSATPTATATATPTNTPIPSTPTAPPATPTPPAPTWHTIGTYSGSTAQTPLATFTTADPWRVVWTCTPGPNNAAFSITATVDGANLAGGGNICGQPATGATFEPCAGGVPACAGSHTYAVNIPTNGSYPEAAWTATISEFF